MSPILTRLRYTTLACLLASALGAASAHAVLDVEDAGPTLRAGNFAMRVTNAGVLGNMFFDVGRSSDPSFEFPANSGIEMMHHAELWVGALDEFDDPRVTGGPALEWRPTQDPDDRVYEAWRGRLGARRLDDDDGDGRIDEETLNRKDDDGDGEIDEDLGLASQQLLAADFRDDGAEAIYSPYPGGEPHHPLHLSVHQEARAWSVAGYTGIAGIEYTITNVGSRALRQVYLGVYADLDAGRRDDPIGKMHDRVETRGYARTIVLGTIQPFDGPDPALASRDNPQGLLDCDADISGNWPIVRDGNPASGLPAIALIPLDHTTDPVGFLAPGLARAPTRTSFRATILSRTETPVRGGVPVVDVDRYAALAGTFPNAPTSRDDDYAVLIACGPFATLQPGQSVRFALALVAHVDADSLGQVMGDAARLYYGDHLNRIADLGGPDQKQWNVGETGWNSHESCIEAPPGTSFLADAHCGIKYQNEARPDGLISPPALFRPGTCVWADADCDFCTGVNGKETQLHWLDPGALPPAPAFRTVPSDHSIRIEWDSMPEVVIAARQIPGVGGKFSGYRLYKLADWRRRESLLPPRDNWQLVGTFGTDSTNGARPLALVTDSAVARERVLFERPLYPVGRYRYVDDKVLNGFDYVYAVTTVSVDTIAVGGLPQAVTHESPLVATFASRVVPQATARGDAGGVWVVPNPYRGREGWDRPPVFGDALTHHIEFMGLPRSKATIKVWTLAGDLVMQIEHDGSNGDGQATWDLVTRNGQDVESGLYLFTVESALGDSKGRFVLIR